MRKYKKIQIKENSKILILAISGIGENILLVPTIRELRRNFPKAKITLAVRFPQVISLLKGLNLIDDFVACDYKIQNTLVKKIKLISLLRSKKFDVTITSFPSKKLDKALFSFLIGSPIRISHTFRSGLMRFFSLLNNYPVEVNENLHDLEQNLNLLLPLGLDPLRADKKLEVHLSEEAKAKAKSFFKTSKIERDELVIGLHPGSSISFGMSNKRWGIEKFRSLAKRIISLYQAKIIAFVGEDDSDLSFGDEVILVKESLDVVASIIARCVLFIANDTGLMHLAAALGVPVIGIFGPTDPKRTGPRGTKSYIVNKKIACSPCYTFERLGKGISCNFSNAKCLNEISVNDVLNEVDKILRR